MLGLKDKDLQLLISRNFIISFESGVIVIRHWKINNSIRQDRKTETVYKDEKRRILEDENGLYNLIQSSNTETLKGKKLEKVTQKDDSRVGGLLERQENDDFLQAENVSCVGGFQVTKENDSRVGGSQIVKKSDSCDDGSCVITGNDSCDDGFQDVIDFYNNNIGSITQYSYEVLADYSGDMSNEVVIFAMKLAVESNARSLKYIKAILNAWYNEKVKTVADAERETENFRKKYSNRKNKEKNDNFEQRNYNDLSFLYANNNWIQKEEER